MCRASTGHPSTAGQHEVEMEHTAVHMPDYILRIRSYYSDGYLKVYLLAA